MKTFIKKLKHTNKVFFTPKFDTLRLKMPVQVLKILVFLLFYILRTCRTCNIILLYGGTIWLE